MSGPAEGTYTYGDSEVAGDRLAVIASIFEPTTAEFLRRDARPAGPTTPELALDLGCGPGYTTALLHATIAPERTVGLERSDAFVLRARVEHADDGLEFLPHDVTVLPFPTGPADVVFARYLLAHLPDPVTVRDRWLTAVRPGGRLLVEEIDHIDTSIDTFARYLDVVQQMSRGHDTELLVGPALADAAPPEDVSLVADTTARISPAPQTVARIFAMNLSVWRDDPWVEAHVDPSLVATLARELHDLRSAAPPTGITWHHRQLAFERSTTLPTPTITRTGSPIRTTGSGCGYRFGALGQEVAAEGGDGGDERVGRLPGDEVAAVAEQERPDVVVEDEGGHAVEVGGDDVVRRAVEDGRRGVGVAAEHRWLAAPVRVEDALVGPERGPELGAVAEGLGVEGDGGVVERAGVGPEP